MPDRPNILDREPALTYTDLIAGNLQNGWLNFGSVWTRVGYTKDTQNIVHLKGLIKEGSTDDNTVIFTLPVGYRPPERMMFSVIAFEANFLRVGRIDIYVDGTVRIKETLANDFLSLDGISFVAGG